MVRDLSLSLTHEPWVMFTFLCPAVEKSERWALTAACHLESTHYNTTFPEVSKFNSTSHWVLRMNTRFLTITSLVRIILSLSFSMGTNPNLCLFVPVFWKPIHTQTPQNQSNANFNCCEGLWNYLYSEAYLVVFLSFVHLWWFFYFLHHKSNLLLVFLVLFVWLLIYIYY